MFSSSLTERQNKLERFVYGKPFPPRLKLTVKVLHSTILDKAGLARETLRVIQGGRKEFYYH
jgi:hypothetical protein